MLKTTKFIRFDKSPLTVFSVVKDVNRYKDFLPWCMDSQVTKPGEEELEADLTIGFGPFNQKYGSRVIMKYPKTIESLAVENWLFNRLDSMWKLDPDGIDSSTGRVDR